MIWQTQVASPSSCYSISAVAQGWESVEAYNTLQGDGTFKRQLAAADASRLHTVADNKLGVAASMELDFGDNMRGCSLCCLPAVYPCGYLTVHACKFHSQLLQRH